MKTNEITPIRTLEDLRKAQSLGLEKGNPIFLRDGQINIETAIFHSEVTFRNDPAIITIERSENEGIVRGLYVITSEGLYYQAHCKTNGIDLEEDTEMYNKHFLF